MPLFEFASDRVLHRKVQNKLDISIYVCFCHQPKSLKDKNHLPGRK